MALKRSNEFCVRPLSEQDERLLNELTDASAALWNETNYERLMRYNNEDEYESEEVWDADTGSLEGKYKSTLSASTAQQVIRKNSEAWRSFFTLKKQYHDPDNQLVTDHPEPPGFWGNKEDGRKRHTFIRNDQYTIEWGDRSRLEIPVGQDLKDKHGLGYHDRLRLEISGDPNWPEYEQQGRLEIWYDEIDNEFRASQPVTLFKDEQATPLADETAALDIGANNLVACTTTTNKQFLYEGRKLFEKFRSTTRYIAELQSNLDAGEYTSWRIKRQYRKRTRRRDHAQAALCRDLVERLYEDGVSTIYVGGLTDILETHWSVETNAKTHNFWAFKQFVERLVCTAQVFGIEVEVRSEAWTSQTCPNCGSIDRTTRHGDTLVCECGFEGHSDLEASRLFLERQTNETVRRMAPPVRFEWDDHSWSESPRSRESPEESRTNQSTTVSGGNVAAGA